MRIIAGKDKGRRLKSLSGKEVRPTSDRAKEALFNILNNEVVGARFLDLCAGFGGIGIEALSRGAYEVIFIEQERQNSAVIKDNLDLITEQDRAQVITGDLLKELKIIRSDFDLIFMDPPYADKELYQKTLQLIIANKLLHEQGLVILEHDANYEIELLKGYKLIKKKSYGQTAFSFLAQGGNR